MEDQSWYDKNDDWLNPLIFGLGQGMTAYGGGAMSQNQVGTRPTSGGSLTEAKGVPVAMNFPMWIPIVVVFGIVVYMFKKK